MKKIIALLIIMINLFTVNIIAYEFTNDEDKINIYNLTFDTLVSCYDDLNDIDYIAIDMNNKFFSEFGKEDKDKILDYLKKYNKTVMNKSLKDLNKEGFTDKFNRLNGNNKNGLFINIVDYKCKNNKIFIEAALYKGPFSVKGVKIVINNKDGRWNLESNRLIW
ncbi:MAG: hypothetical protein KID00_11745 [Clostridium argentinense]|uniref:DUF4829 domain-containing protein n=1 Tax=Clostridium faecium TaxID=2762223 RepID=A0ABR8YXB0_9CLOT|nr:MULTISPECIES: hypothetical protein [Clostridium]MBD8048871.1 hypothetical protein [Clostridium faecium]MBS5824501.1 hypothetical protein [Clostridium argentinense]MDU1350486.1 hypothetical protein [Clostridium argentinense]